MPATQAFVLMNSELVATALPRDAAQGEAQQALRDEFFATCSAHGAAKRRVQGYAVLFRKPLNSRDSFE